MRAMRQKHGIINQERIILVALNVINQELINCVRPIGNLGPFTISNQKTIPKTLLSLGFTFFYSRPDTMLIKKSATMLPLLCIQDPNVNCGRTSPRRSIGWRSALWKGPPRIELMMGLLYGFSMRDAGRAT